MVGYYIYLTTVYKYKFLDRLDYKDLLSRKSVRRAQGLAGTRKRQIAATRSFWPLCAASLRQRLPVAHPHPMTDVY